jgi:hypothetical protein
MSGKKKRSKKRNTTKEVNDSSEAILDDFSTESAPLQGAPTRKDDEDVDPMDATDFVRLIRATYDDSIIQNYRKQYKLDDPAYQSKTLGFLPLNARSGFPPFDRFSPQLRTFFLATLPK